MELPTSSRVVVIGDPTSLDHLRAALDPALVNEVTLHAPDELLAPYDRETSEGAERRRALEHLYASLRGKILVRLLVANLIPELAKSQSELPLTRLRKDWDEIQRRMVDLLNEGAHDGVRFVTILITEEGDWRTEHRQDLRALAGIEQESSNVDQPKRITDSSTPKHRCYLITRMLELGGSEVMHARDVWPVLVINLIRFFLDSFRRDSNYSALEDPGLFAWRTVRFVAKLDQRQVMERTRTAFTEFNRLLLDQSEPALFLEPLERNRALVDSFDEPAGVLNAREKISITPWHQIGTVHDGHAGNPRDATFPEQEIAALKNWLPAIREFAIAKRKYLEDLRREGIDFDANQVQSRVQNAQGAPGKLFPGQLPGFMGKAEQTAQHAFSEIANKLNEMESSLQKLGPAGVCTARLRAVLFRSRSVLSSV
jgi:hypothetical protein